MVCGVLTDDSGTKGVVCAGGTGSPWPTDTLWLDMGSLTWSVISGAEVPKAFIGRSLGKCKNTGSCIREGHMPWRQRGVLTFLLEGEGSVFNILKNVSGGGLSLVLFPKLLLRPNLALLRVCIGCFKH